MIKFFRKIRQQLLTENKFSKYLLYAIGEIFLVVIGILLALSINTWQSNKKDRAIERDYIDDLIKDLRQDTSRYSDGLFNNVKKKTNVLNQTRAYLFDNYHFTDTLSFLRNVGFGGKFGIDVQTINNSTYTELLNTGNFRIIIDKAIRKEIIYYYGGIDRRFRTLFDYRTDYPHFINSLRPYTRETRDQLTPADQRIMLNGLKDNRFLGLVNQELTFADNLERVYNRLSEIQNSLLQKLEAYREEIN